MAIFNYFRSLVKEQLLDPFNEMGNEYKETIEYSLSVYKMMGLHPKAKRSRVIALTAFYTILHLFLLIVVVAQFAPIKKNIFEFVSNLEATASFVHLLGKIVITAYQQKNLDNLCDNVSRFWSTSRCSADLKFQLDLLLVRSLSLQKLFLRFVAAYIVLIWLGIFLGRPLPMGAWNMEGHDVLYKIVVVLQSVVLYFSGVFTVSVICNFLGLCTIVIVQFKIFCHSLNKISVINVFSNTTEGNYYEELKLHVKHHVFLMKFVKSLQATYSPVILLEFVTMVPLICAEMYILGEVNTTPQLIRYSMAFSSLLMDLGFYCILADHVTGEAIAVSDALYESDWFSNYVPLLRKPVPFILQRSQQQKTFTAGGLIDLRSSTVINLVKVSWSACTIMRALKDK